MIYKPVLIVSKLAEESPRALPLGAARVAAVLGAKAAVLVVAPGETPEDFIRRIAEAKPIIAGFSVYLWSREFLCTSSRGLKKLLPDTLLLAGGPEASADPKGLMEAGAFDAVLAGEGESVIWAIFDEFTEKKLNFGSWKNIDGLYLRGQKIPRVGRSPSAGLSSLPSPYLSGHLDPREYHGALWELSRGCPFTCTYCYESRGEKLSRSVTLAQAEQDLEFLDSHGADRVFVLDPTFNVNKKRTLAILDLIARVAPDLHYDFEVRAELLDREQAEAFSRVNTALQIGLQSASNKVLHLVGRDIKPGQFREKLRYLDEAGVIFGLDLIIGLPGDTPTGFLESLDFALSCRPNHLDMFRLAILPGTTLAADARGFGIDHDPESPYLVRSTPDFSASDLSAAELIASVCMLFYNRGRAVTWFSQVLRLLGWKAGYFFSWCKNELDSQILQDSEGSESISMWQAKVLVKACKTAGLTWAAKACQSLALYHGAWARAMAEGIETVLDLDYLPEDLEGAALVNLKDWARGAKIQRRRYRISPDKRLGLRVSLLRS